MRSREERPRCFRTHDDFLPYLSARNSIHGGYKSCDWREADRRLVLWVKVAFLAATGGLICIAAIIIV